MTTSPQRRHKATCFSLLSHKRWNGDNEITNYETELNSRICIDEVDFPSANMVGNMGCRVEVGQNLRLS